MLCDLQVPNAPFNVKIQNEKDLIYQNDIRHAGTSSEQLEVFTIVFRNQEVESHAAAQKLVTDQLERIKNAISVRLLKQPDFVDWKITALELAGAALPEVTLHNAGTLRNDPSFVIVG